MGLTTGLVVMGGVSCLRGCGFESEHRILEGPDFTLVCFENCLKRPKQNEKEAVLRWLIVQIKQTKSDFENFITFLLFKMSKFDFNLGWK